MSQKITNSYADYDKIEALRSTELKLFMRSPAIYRQYQTGLYKIPQSDSMRIGTVLHALLIEGKKEYAVFEGRRAGKRWEEFKAENADVPILRLTDKVDEEWELLQMVESVRRCKPAMELFERVTNREQTITFQYQSQPCKVRLDLWLDDASIVDIKTCTNPLPEPFWRNGIDAFGYHHQMAFYSLAIDSYLEASEIQRDCYFVAVANKAPWRTIVHRLQKDVQTIAEHQVRQAIEEFIECREKNEWPDREADMIHEYVPSMWWYNNNNAAVILGREYD